MRDSLAAAGVDALVVYSSMRERFRDAGIGAPLPAPSDPNGRIVFGGGVVVRDGQTHPAAARFMEHLIAPAGQAVLTRGGFLTREHAALRVVNVRRGAFGKGRHDRIAATHATSIR